MRPPAFDLLLCLVNPYKVSHESVMQTIELMGTEVIPPLRTEPHPPGTRAIGQSWDMGRAPGGTVGGAGVGGGAGGTGRPDDGRTDRRGTRRRRERAQGESGAHVVPTLAQTGHAVFWECPARTTELLVAVNTLTLHPGATLDISFTVRNTGTTACHYTAPYAGVAPGPTVTTLTAGPCGSVGYEIRGPHGGDVWPGPELVNCPALGFAQLARAAPCRARAHRPQRGPTAPAGSRRVTTHSSSTTTGTSASRSASRGPEAFLAARRPEEVSPRSAGGGDRSASMVETPPAVSGADLIAGAAALSNDEIVERLDALFRQKAAVEGAIVVLLGEVGRRQSYREEGATGPEPWAVERFGVSVPTARAYAHLGEKAWDIAHLVESLCSGELSFDKVRAVAGAATPDGWGAARPGP